MAFALTLIGPTEHTEYALTSLQVMTPKGALTIYEQHAPLMSQLVSHELEGVREDGTHVYKVIQGGILHVERKHVTIILNQ
jgi:F0F1-type ATP synthase epsilon subunit